MTSTQPMELLFCDVCNESVPQKDLDDGRAVRRKGRVVCATCEEAMSAENAQAAKGEATPAGSATRAAAAATGGSAAGSAGGAGPSSVSGSAHSSRGGGGSNAAAVALGSVALVAAVGGTAFLHDRVKTEESARLGALASLRSAIEENEGRMERSVESEVSDLAAELTRLRGELAGFRERLDESAREERERTDGLRNELSSTAQRITAVEVFEDQLDELDLRIDKLGGFTADLYDQQLRQEQRIEALRADLGSVRDLAAVDVGALVGANEGEVERPKEARPAWMDFVGDLKSQSASVRWQAVQSIGQSGDMAAAEYLAPMLKDPDIFVRMAAARNLGDLAAPIGIPALIDALEDPEESVRESAAVSLRAVTEKDFRFDPGAKESERAKSVKRWRDWWETAQEELLGAEE